jgi:hypothetical protein
MSPLFFSVSPVCQQRPARSAILYVLFCLSKDIRSPLIETLSVGFSHHQGPCVDFRGDSQHQFPGTWLLRSSPESFRHLEVPVNRLTKPLFQFRHGLTMKSDNIDDSGDAPNKKTILSIKFDMGRITAFPAYLR